MKMRTDKDILKFFAASMGMALAGALLFVYVSPFIGGGLILGGLILTVMGLYVASKPKEEFVQDERSKRVMDKAGHHAFWIMMDIVIVLSLINQFSLYAVEFKSASTLILFIGIYSFLILKWYYNKKGE
ncbi:MAG: DUF2178 domain-containing protein [Candidatus Methanoperedens sp.]|nr:DUF2178 domain-containing protein [Candidatus Methanoperedens sp.]